MFTGKWLLNKQTSNKKEINISLQKMVAYGSEFDTNKSMNVWGSSTSLLMQLNHK